MPLEAGSDIVSGAEGMLALPSLIQRGANWGLTSAADWALGVTPQQRAQIEARTPAWGRTLGDPGSWLPTATDALGVTNNSALAPQSPWERFAGAGLKAAPAIAAAIASGQVETLPAIASGLTAAGGAELAGPKHPYLGLAASVLGGMGAQGLTQSLSGGRLEAIASKLGDSKTWEDAGLALQEAARDWSKALPAKLTALAAPLKAKVPDAAPVDLDPILGAMNGIVGKGGMLAGAIQTMAGKAPQHLQKFFQNLKDLADLTGGPNSAGWKDVREFRTYLGNALANPKLAGDLDNDALEHLYAVTTKTLGDTAASHGATDEWNTFNTESTRLHQFQRGPLAKIITTENPGREGIQPAAAAQSVFSAAKKGNIDQVRRELPDATDEVAATVLRQGKWDSLSPEGKTGLVPDVGTQKTLRLMDTAPPSPIGRLAHVGESGFGGYAGGIIGEMAAHGLGIHPSTGKLVGEGIGLVVPYAAHAGRLMLRDPNTRVTLPMNTAVGLGVTGLGPTGGQ
jgi:hypothetical protein